MTTPDHRADLDLDQLELPAPRLIPFAPSPPFRKSTVWSEINALADRIAAMEAAVSAIAAKLEAQQ
jgi:hypothetical protein